MELKEIRNEIDEIDKALLPLFIKRMQCSEKVAEIKAEKGLPILNSEREQEIIKRVKGNAGIYGNAAKELYTAIMSASRERQRQILGSSNHLLDILHSASSSLPATPLQIACPGAFGAFTHKAGLALFPNSQTNFYPSFEGVVKAVKNGSADFGVLPVENSSAGSVSEVYDLILKHRFSIAGAVTLKIHHCLAAAENSGEIHTVLSHPQALAQCESFLEKNKWQLAPASNTAAAAQYVAQASPKHTAVICSKEAAEKYGLRILAENIQNNHENCTRFIAISSNWYLPKDADKISLCFALPHETGSLYSILSRFAMNGLNLTKIESRPIPEKTFEYDFYLDFTGNLHNSSTCSLLCSLQDELPRFSFLGNYKEYI